MVQTIYVVQTFSRDQSGRLIWDAPTWSQDRSFAVSLTQALSKRKAGVVTVGVALDHDGLGSEAEIVASQGTIPLDMVLSAARKGVDGLSERDPSMKRRARA